MARREVLSALEGELDGWGSKREFIDIHSVGWSIDTTFLRLPEVDADRFLLCQVVKKLKINPSECERPGSVNRKVLSQNRYGSHKNTITLFRKKRLIHFYSMYLKELDIELLEKNFTKKPGEEHPTMLVLVAEEELFYVNEMIEFFNNHNIKVFGGIFPGLIYNGQYKSKGAILIPLAAVYEPVVFTDLTQTPFSLHSLFDRIESSDNIVSHIFFDGFSHDIKKFLSETYLKLGNSVKYIGGGAGTSDYIQKPVIFSNSGIFQDAAVICLAKSNSIISVRHGWELLDGPYLVTSSEKNIVKTINWQNAYMVYKEALQEYHINLKALNIDKIALKYPLGVFKEGMEYILRSPIQRTQNNELVCVGEVPENSAVYILAGDKDSLLKASETATREALKYDGNPLGAFTIIDYLRSVFLGDAFDKEVKNVYNNLSQENPDSLNYGALTIGEIASYPSGSMDLFNKSFVIGTTYG